MPSAGRPTTAKSGLDGGGVGCALPMEPPYCLHHKVPNRKAKRGSSHADTITLVRYTLPCRSTPLSIDIALAVGSLTLQLLLLAREVPVGVRAELLLAVTALAMPDIPPSRPGTLSTLILRQTCN